MADLTTGEVFGNYTELIFDGRVVAARGNKSGKIFEICHRCGGTGHYSFNLLDGTICYGCMGKRVVAETTEADVIRKAVNRAKAADRRAKKAKAQLDAARATMDAWQAANADLVEALRPHLTPVDAEGYADFSFRPANTFLTSMADQAIRTVRPLTSKQAEAARNALRVQAQRDEERAAQQAAGQAAGHLGTPGQKVEAVVTLESAKFLPGDWNRSNSYLITMRTEAGHVLKTFSSGAFGDTASEMIDRAKEQGQNRPQVTITGTVKAHDEYNGEPQTMLTRVKINS